MGQRKRGVILGYISLIITNGASFIITPIMLSVWDKSQYGVYQLCMTMAAYFLLMDLGINNSIVKYVSQYRTKNEKQNENHFVGVIITFYLALGIVIALGGLVVLHYFPVIFKHSMTIKEVAESRSIFAILLLNTYLSLFFNLFKGIVNAYERFTTLKFNDIAKTVMRFTTIFILLRLGLPPIKVVIADTIINAILGLSIGYIVIFSIKTRPTIRGITLSYFYSIINYSFFVFVNVLAIQLFWMVDKIILGILTSTAIVAVYSIGTLINSYFQSFSSVFSSVLMPGVVKLVSQDADQDILLNEAIRIGRLKLIFLLWLAVGLVFFGKQFIILWAGPGYVMSYYVALIVILPQVIANSQDVAANVMWAKEKHKTFSVVMLLVALLNCLITVVLVKKIGMLGGAIGTTFAFTGGFIVFASIYYHRVLPMNMFKFYIGISKGIFIATLLAASVSYSISLWGCNSWSVFLVEGLLMSVCYFAIMFYVGFNPY